MVHDVLSLESDVHDGEQLIKLVMERGKRVQPSPSLADARALAARGLEQLPEPLRRLEPGATLTVQIGEPLVKLTAEVDRRLGLGLRLGREA
jgi:nicotinate phosphoribosyltransferase